MTIESLLSRFTKKTENTFQRLHYLPGTMSMDSSQRTTARLSPDPLITDRVNETAKVWVSRGEIALRIEELFYL